MHNRSTATRRSASALLLLLAAFLPSLASADFTQLSAVKIGTAAQIATGNADTYFGSATTHTISLATAGAGNLPCTSPTSAGCPPEIRELARALKGNVDLIYDYVHNHIDTVWMFGLQKGALGALIDKSGTPFDQAALMVELLRAGGQYPTVKYRYGSITLDTTQELAQFKDATNIDPAVAGSAQAACLLMASGGIPVMLNSNTGSHLCSFLGTQTLTKIVFRHVWVRVTIGGTDFDFDPSFKTYNWHTPLNLAAVTGLTSGDPLVQATSGSTSGTDSGASGSAAYTRNVNAEQLNAAIQTYAAALLTNLKSNPSFEMEDVIGGGTIGQVYTAQNPQRLGALAQHALVLDWTDVPDQYRTKLEVNPRMWNMRLQTPGYEDMFDVTFYVDEIYGRRLSLDTDFASGLGWNDQAAWYSEVVYLKLDGVTLATYTNSPLTAQPPMKQFTSRGVPAQIILKAFHPYAASSDPNSTSRTGTYMDTTVTKPLTLVTSATIVHGWGDTSQALFAKWSGERSSDVDLARGWPQFCFNGTERCPAYYNSPRGDASREKVAVGWLAQNTRQVRINAAIANSIAQIHHAIGVVYGDASLDTSSNCSGQICTDPYKWVVDDSFDRIDVDMAFSITSRTGDVTTRRAAVYTIASASAALEGSMMAQLADLPDTASTATRFEWANRPPAAEDPSGTNNYRHFQLYSPSNVTATQNAATGLVTAEGHTNSSDGVTYTAWNSQPLLTTADIADFRQGLYDSIFNYVYNGGFQTVIASQDSFLGPGQRGGKIKPQYYNGGITGYTHNFTKQRGGAFVATRTDANGDPIEIAHVVLGLNTTSVATIATKGGGGGQPPDTAQKYNPAEAADVLKARFVDRSTALGVNLATGSVSYTSPAALTVGNGGFPYELSASYSWQAGPFLSPGQPISPIQPFPGWTTNWHNSAGLSGSGMEAMGQSDIRAAAGTIAAFLVAQDIYKQSQSITRDVAGVLTMSWWTHQISGNVVSVAVGHSARQFVRLVDGTWILPGTGYATLAQNGARATYEKICGAGSLPPYAMSRSWNTSNISFDVTNANGDVQHFGSFTNAYQLSDDDAGCGEVKGFRLTTWTFPYNVVVTMEYSTGGIEGITGVHNNVGRRIAYSGSNLQDGASASRQVQYITSEPGPNFSQSFIDPAGNKTGLAYVAPIDRSDTQRPITYSQLWRVFAADNLSQPNLEYTYDAVGRVKEAHDAIYLQVGDAAHGGRDAYQFLIAEGGHGERIDPLLQNYAVDYDDRGRPARYIDELSHITLATFDGRGRVLSYTYPEGDQETFVYDVRNNTTEFHRKAKPGCTPSSECADIVVAATWHTAWNKPLTVVDARGNTTNFTYFETGNGKGLLQQAQRPLAHTTDSYRAKYSFTYDDRGRVLTASTPIGVNDTNFVVTTNTYDSTYRNLQTSTYDSGSGHLNAVTTYTYDATYLQDVASVADARSNVTETTYDLNRRKLVTISHDGAISAARIGETRTTYDAVGRVTKEEAVKCFNTASPCLASGTTEATWITVKQTDYTRTGKPWKVTDADGQATRTYYDALDRTLTVADPLLRQVHYVYCLPTDGNCAANQVRIEQRGFGSADQIDYATYTYTLNGKQATVLDADGGGHVTVFGYDAFDRLKTTTFPYDPALAANPVETLAYYTAAHALCSANGSPCTRITRGNQTIAYTYDALDRMETKAVPGTSGTRTVTWAYDLAGRIEMVSDSIGNSADPTYNTAGWMISNTRSIPELTASQQVQYQYDAAGNRTRLIWPDGSYWVDYAFDNLNRMSSATENSSGTAFTLANYTYDALSRRTKIAYAPSTGGATMSYTYSDAGDLGTLNHNMSGSANDAQFTLTYTAAHQLASMALNKTNYLWQATGTCTDTYTHNDLNQYATLAWCGGTATNASHDPNGNMTTATMPTAVAWTFSYDAENRMLSASASGGAGGSYSYDILDHRSAKLVSAVYTMFLGDAQDEEIAEYKHVSDGGTPDWTPTLLRRFVPGPGIDQPIAMVDVTSGSAVRTYFHVNRLGSVIAMSGDTSAKTEGPYTYDPYGNLCGASGAPGCTLPGGVPFKFTGRRFDPETGLYYYRARYYSPQLGRFLQTDPIGYQADMNLYTYVGDDPLDRTDPSGQVWGALISGFVIGAALDYGEQVVNNTGVQIRTDSVSGFIHSVSDVVAHIDRQALTNVDGGEIVASGAISAGGGLLGRTARAPIQRFVNRVWNRMMGRNLSRMSVADRVKAVSNAVRPSPWEEATATGNKVAVGAGIVGGLVVSHVAKEILHAPSVTTSPIVKPNGGCQGTQRCDSKPE